MNKKSIYSFERRVLNLVRFSNRSGSQVNSFRYNSSSTDEHEDMKFRIFKCLRKLKHNVLVEAIFSNGSRADIVDVTEGVVYEVMHSERLADCKEKVKHYPSELEVRFVDAGEEFDEGLL